MWNKRVVMLPGAEKDFQWLETTWQRMEPSERRMVITLIFMAEELTGHANNGNKK